MANTAPKLVLSGENVTVTLFVGGKPVPNASALAKSCTVTEQATMYRDKYLGRVRDRVDKKVTGYDCKLEFDYADNVLFTQLRSIDTAREANSATLPDLTVGLVMANRDGSADGYALQKCVAKVEIGFKGKDDRVSYSVDIQAEDFVSVTL